MKFLLDTNLLIRLEPTAPQAVEAGTQVAIELIRLVSEGGHQPYIHPASLLDLASDRDESRRSLRETLAGKYPELPSPPRVQSQILAELGRPVSGSHDEIDFQLLAAVVGDAVDYFVTDDHPLLRRARRLGLGSRVLSPADALATVRGLSRRFPETPPAVRQLYVHELDEADPIFDSFREDYPGFDHWFRRCKRLHRTSWAIQVAGRLGAVAIVKEESDREHGLPGRLLKVCTFKVSDLARGRRFGELLLKPIFAYAFENAYDHVYLEIFPKYGELVDLLECFGFQILPARTEKGELVLAKSLKFSSRDVEALSALDFHIRFGPRYLRAKDVFCVPIRPEYHDMLFPEFASQHDLFASESPFGNSILKAYLCHAQTRQLTPGSVVLFYQSGGETSVRCLGVVEATLVTALPADLAHFVGQRTVYSLQEIESMCRKQEVLAVLFRQASGVITQPITLDDLMTCGALTAAPQSITRIRAEGLEWIRDQIELSP